MATVDKVKQGRKSKRKFFDFTHDVNTTMDFGFCQPIMVDLVQPGSNVKLKTKQFVRLAPLPTPTFARVKVHTDTMFVPLSDVFPASKDFFSHTPINTRTSYIPEKLDFIQKPEFISMLFALTNYYSKLGDFDKCPLRYSFVSNMWLNDVDRSNAVRIPYRDILNDSTVASSVSRTCTAYHFLQKYFSPTDAQRPYSFWGLNYSLMFPGSSWSPDRLSLTTGSVDPSLNRNYPSLLAFLTNTPDRLFYSGLLYGTGTYPIGYSATFGFINKYDNQRILETFLDGVSNGKDELDTPISLNSCDFYVKIPYSELPDVTFYDDNCDETDKTYPFFDDAYFCVRLTRAGRRLMRLFNAMRLNPLGKYIDDIPLAPVFAYYKAWFDLYNPGRVYNWEVTNAYNLIHLYYDYNVDVHTWYWQTDNSQDFSTNSYRLVLLNFLLDLTKCCYVLPVDNVSVAIDAPGFNVQTDVNDVDVYYDGTDSSSTTHLDVHDYSPYGTDSIVNDAGGLGVKMLERVYYMTNADDVAGKRVRDILKRYNILLPPSAVLKRTSYMCDISDVFSTAETSEGYLGEYAGKGIGSGSSSVKLRDVKDYGYLVQLVSISPHAGYVQGSFRHPMTRMQFYQPKFDSLGHEPMAMSEVQNRSYSLSSYDEDEVFGFRPRYFGLKVRNNIANGYFAERSMMSQYLPYSLDRLFTVDDVRYSDVGKKINVIPGYTPYAGEDIRFVGINESVGLYDRIFYQTNGLVDNFIMHILQDYKVYAPMKPVSESFDVYDPETDDDAVEITHS